MRIYLPSNETLCHCAVMNLSPQVVETLEKCRRRLYCSPDSHPVKKHLPKGVFRKLQYRTTQLGANLLDVVKVGMIYHNARQIAVAPDEYAYDTFKAIFDGILEEYHFGFQPNEIQPCVNWGSWKCVDNLDFGKRFIVSTRVRCSRNLQGHRFIPTMTADDLTAVEIKIVELLEKLPWEYSGTYIPVDCLEVNPTEDMKSCMFHPRDKYEQLANVSRYWPIGRGIFVNEDCSFAVWVNEKDHMRVICVQKSGDLQTAYRVLSIIMPVLDRRLRTVRHPRLGFLTVSPGNVGTALHASVHVRLPKVPRNILDNIAKVYHLEVRCLNAEKNLYQVGNRRRLGYTEYEIIKEFNLGMRELLYKASDYDTAKQDAHTRDKKKQTKEEDNRSISSTRDSTNRNRPFSSDHDPSRRRNSLNASGKKRKGKGADKEKKEATRRIVSAPPGKQHKPSRTPSLTISESSAKNSAGDHQ